MKIFIDFDDVIFNAKKFKNDLIKIFSKNKVSQEDFFRSYEFTKKSLLLYKPEKQLQFLIKDGKIKNLENLRRDLDLFMGNLKRYVFKDALNFLEKFSIGDFYLLSYGDKDFQAEKIKNSKITDYFKKIIITNKNKAEAIKNLISDPRETYFFIDDKIEHLKEMEKINNMSLFYLKRDIVAEKFDIKNCKAYSVKNFREISTIIKKINLNL